MITIDIHTHILHGTDDGAVHINEAISLLESEVEQGIETVVLTPHFCPEENEIDEFLQQRQKKIEALREAASHLPIRLLAGAEVLYSNRIPEFASRLCIEGTPYLLIEFQTYVYPQISIEVFRQLRQQGIVPIIAHGERYRFPGAVALMEKLVNVGALVQVNVDSILNFRLRKRIYELADRDMIHLLASDAHSQKTRPPLWHQALPKWKKKVSGLVSYCEDNVLGIFPKEVLK